MKGRIIIIEGVDCTGKSTLAQSFLLQGPRHAILHAGAPQCGTAYDEYVRPLRFARDQGWTVICDRWHLGELVWPSIFGRDSLYYDTEELHEVENSLRRYNVPIDCIYLTRDPRAVKDELDKRDEPFDFIDDAFELYETALAQSTLSWHVTSLLDAMGLIA
jgi:thymidylate kinase